MSEPTNAASASNRGDSVLDKELEMVKRMHVAFQASLARLEAARDDLVEMQHRIERLTHTSATCRQVLGKGKENSG